MMRTEHITPFSVVNNVELHSFVLNSYGLNIRIISNSLEFLEDLKNLAGIALIGNLKIHEEIQEGIAPDFELKFEQKGDTYLFYDLNGKIAEIDASLVDELFLRKIRVLIAEYAVDQVFVHAGVVVWNNKLIMIPGNSGTGKTTLTAEFVKLGALYYSDEYAVIDKDGLVHPFARDLSLRKNGQWSEKNGVPVENLGGKAGIRPLPVNFVIFTEFDINAKWSFNKVTTGEGILEIIKYSLPIGHKPEFSINILKIALENAIIFKCMRGEAATSAQDILYFIDNCID